jgi:membrane protein YdbS with pleckstrin-like domain
MLTNETTTESTPQVQGEPMADGPVIVAPGAPGAIVQPPAAHNEETGETTQTGIEGEETVWEGRYSGRNFIGRIVSGGLLLAIWIVVLVNGWRTSQGNQTGGGFFWTVVLGIVVLAYWANLGYRYLRAYRGHHYRLTNRRLFVTTGFFQRRVDQIELIRIKDVYIQQSMIGDWFGIGHVVVISSEQSMPKAYLLGIDQPRRIMDLIWHHMRLEQAEKTNRINPV